MTEHGAFETGPPPRERVGGDGITGDGFTDEVVIERILSGERALFEVLMRRYNRMVFRLVRGVVRDNAEAEDVTQDAWVRAFEHLGQYAGRAAFSTWVGRIALYEALARVRRRGLVLEIDGLDEPGREAVMSRAFRASEAETGPEQHASGREARDMLEAAIAALPPAYRVVVMLRDIEELDTAATADMLDLSVEAVKTRLHRARRMLRESLSRRLGAAAAHAFSFDGERCDRVVAHVLSRISPA